ncbi:uncharacterized protein [Aristolochia californica]|uniref:uncharacterized protein n=1 Tax=Aristolochia californica TaxID=171875 RepID=UPI0035D660AF
MGTRRIFTFDARGGFVHGRSLNELLCRKMVLFVSSCWLFVFNSILAVIRFIVTYFLRFRIEKSSGKDDTSFEPFLQNDEISDLRESLSMPEVIEFEKTEYDGFEEKETPRFSFKFQFSSPEEIRRKIEESEEPVHQEKNDSTETNVQLYRFLGEKNFVGFIEQPEVFNLRVEYSYPEVEDSSSEDAEVFKKELSVQNVRTEESVPSVEFPSNNNVTEENSQKPEVGTLADDQVSIKDSLFELSIDNLADRDAFDEAPFLSQRDFFGSNSDLESLNSFIEISAGDQGAEISGYFLTEGDFTGHQQETPSDFEEKDTHLRTSCNSEKELNELNDDMNQDDNSLTGSSAVVNQIISSNPSEEQNPDGDLSIPKNRTELIETIEEPEDVHHGFNSRTETQATEPENKSQTAEGTNFQSSTDSDSDSLWEHQDLIEQLRMELKKVRAIGLPTILEESESPKTMFDLKPWKFEEKFLQEDPMDELQKFYKSYRERMRKFDILNYQKMYAIGFLQLKDPLQSTLLTKKSSVPSLTSLLSRRRKVEDDPSKKLIKELQSDLETVYVGQTCLSWEFMQWQHGKACESDPNDSFRTRSYNQVAGEFQQFQVVLQRFLENEEFEGPRVQNYVKSRCVLRNFLQVPTIREDRFKDKKEERRWRRENSDLVTCSMLVNFIEQSMRIMCEFIKADKEETGLLPRGLSGAQTEELQDPSDLQLFHDVQINFHKKEKKLRDLLRTGQCLVKRFQKHQGNDMQQVMFLAQVDIKLVGRVLRMRRVTSDQLMWCDKKLNRITFSDRKVYREPSFLLFPC